MSKSHFKFCQQCNKLGVRCERGNGHKGKHAYVRAPGGSHPTFKKGWVIIYPNGDIETDYFQRTVFENKGVRISAKRWREIYRPRCKMVKGTLSWVLT